MFAATPQDSARAVLYLRRELPQYPVYLFTIAEPAADVSAQCERVFVKPTAWALQQQAWQVVRARWIALGLAAWTNQSTPRLLKFAPLLTPPFRTLVMNEHGGFFSPSPRMLGRHAWGRVRGAQIWPQLSGFAQERWFYTKLWFRRKAVGLRDRLRHYWRWWPVLLRNWWDPVRVYLIYELLHGEIDRVLSILQRLQDVYWAVADPFQKRDFSLLRLLLGIWRYCWARPVSRWLAGRYPRTQERFRLYAAHPAEPFVSKASARTANADVVSFPYAAKLWSRSLLVRLASESSARFILLLRGTAVPSDFATIAPLFRDPDTFAVSYQTETRSWDRSLFCRAPFRVLQPGEASQVLAPIADAIWVDRTKLEALGVPFTWFPQAALLILFWKAAAAGWRSYQVGSTDVRSIPEAVRWPSEETEAAERLMQQRVSVPDTRLAWGNTAFHVTHFPPALRRERPLRVLIVSPYLPFPLSHGGAVRIYNLCKALSPKVEFLLATFREKTDIVQYDKLHELFREVHVVDRDESLSPDESLPQQVRGQQSRAMEALIGELCRTRDIDLVQIEYTHLAPLRAHAPKIPAILVEHDITFSLYSQFAQQTPTPEARAEYERWRSFERDAFQSYDAVWTMSEADRSLALSESASREKTWVVPNGVDIERFQPVEVDTAAPEIFFVGSFRHYPNIIGFERLRLEVMPRVWERYPSARLRVIAGPDPDHYWRELKREAYPASFDERILLHGFTEDLRPLYAQAAVVAIPLLVSAGTNIKLMEAMACGKAIVSTVVGCAGLDLEDGRDLLVRDSSESFSEGLLELLGSPDYRRRIARQARRTAEERFSWISIADTAYASYEQLAAARPVSRPV